MERAGWVRIDGKEINTFVPVWFVNSWIDVDEYVSDGPIHSARDFYEKNLIAQREVINRAIISCINKSSSQIINYATPVLKNTFTLCPELIRQMEKRGWVVKPDEVGVQFYPVWLKDGNANPKEYKEGGSIVSAYTFYITTLKRQAEEIVDLISSKERVNLPYEVYPALVGAMRMKGWEYKPLTKYSQLVLPYSYFYPKWANGEC